MQARSPFHPGELMVQERAGESGVAGRNGAMIADTIMAGALPFLREREMFVVGGSSPQGEVWASVLFGPPGFVESRDGKTLSIHLDPDARDGDDPFWESIAPESAIGGLAIDLATRRRLRVNGRVAASEPGLLTVAVAEAYPNCPKYIQRRILRRRPDSSPGPRRAETGRTLKGVTRDAIERADTLFVASSNPSGGADVSHRGGKPGFVEVVDDRTLRVPDYRGNGMFNTLGNLAINPSAGILIVDFAGHRTLQLTGKAQLEWRQSPGAREGAATDRSWTFIVDRWVSRRLGAAMDWEYLDASPYNPR
jgi:predicted pyridoxine 5'-phosphate oxidase superfamily flavin-nucleotide-binding protein